jgi:S-DNA-T family DNA segregation ATPase FtsK/SpoIIIE
VEEVLDPGSEVNYDDEYDRSRARIIEDTLKAFGAPVNVVEINRGPVITQFGVEPDFIETRNGRMRVRVGKIASLADDLALALSARTIRVEAPVPGKGYVGIEVPNSEIAAVALRDVIESEAFKRLKSPLRFALGQDVAGNAVAADLSAMPHLLIAGATGSGKSVCVNALICCLLLHNTPDDLRLIMVDPKRVELTGYNGIPHLLAPVVVDMERVTGALQWVLREMDMRYHKLAQAGTRNISEFNNKAESVGEKKLPRLVVFIDELADLMMLAPDETERTITRLAQLARATGIHLVIATQRPSVEVVTGIIKANFPSRIAFAVASGVDSRVILDQPGAERLLGRGDMLFQAPDSPAPLRMQGAFVSDNEIQRLVNYWLSFQSSSAGEPLAPGIIDAIPTDLPLKQMPLWDDGEDEEDKDPLYDEAVDLSRRQGRASISMLQRRLRIGYTRAARLVESMQDKGIIGKEAGPQGFEILDYGPAAPPVDEG